MKSIAAQMDKLDQDAIAAFEQSGSISFTVEGEPVTVDATDVEIISEDIPGWLVANEGNLTVALEVQLTDALRKEGMARELINRIQNLRKEAGLEITDRINVVIAKHPDVEAAIADYADYVKSQVLANHLSIGANEGTEVDFDHFKLNISIQKI